MHAYFSGWITEVNNAGFRVSPTQRTVRPNTHLGSASIDTTREKKHCKDYPSCLRPIVADNTTDSINVFFSQAYVIGVK
jgi:hypothetical protein